MSVFTKRLMEARKAAGLSQERLGILANIDPVSASARMNQYEKGKHVPNILVVRQIAAALNVPEAYFYASDDEAAELLVMFHRLSKEKRLRVLQAVEAIAASQG